MEWVGADLSERASLPGVLAGVEKQSWLVAGRLAIAAYQRAGGPTEVVTDAVERLTGRAPRTLREFAADHRVALRT